MTVVTNNLNDRMQWVYTVYLLKGVTREITISGRGVFIESFTINDEDVTPEIIGLTKRNLIDTKSMKVRPSERLQTEIAKSRQRAAQCKP